MPELSVSKKTIYEILSSMQGKKFIIPQYQRPYSWYEEQCNTLWNDLVDFYESNMNKKDEYYFLGSIVTYKTDKGLGIIDGQQRITSFSLLLRSLYKKLENMMETDEVKGLMSDIEPCIWDINRITKKVDNNKSIHIESKVIVDEKKKKFHDILINGVDLDSEDDDLYTLNSIFFYKKIEEFAKDNTTQWYNFCDSILNKCIILPIECDNFDIGLTIFHTLNNRGLQLSDSDIFKSELFKIYNKDRLEDLFSSKWEELSEKVEKAYITLDDIFRYYMYVIRARNSISSKEVGLRSFYSQNKYDILKKKNVIDDLISLSDFWIDVNWLKQSPNINLNYNCLKYLHCLQYYTNEYWKYIISVFYLENKDNINFNDNFSFFLKRLISFLFIKAIEGKKVNDIKIPIFKASIDVCNGKYDKVFIDDDIECLKNAKEFKISISNSSRSKVSSSIILLKAYLNKKQKTIIEDVHIEHILPKKWQNTNYKGWDKKDADEYLDKYGNKVPLEYKLNILAGNKYFGEKKKIYLGKNSNYSKSNVMDIIDIANTNKTDWSKKDIEKRNEEFVNTIYNFLKKSFK
ncbi:DUF262 domain-containing protein [Brachyspira pilosicoli]|uniref:DUF262 domain-containing protein n=2 Tax=Brachyspira pilosicoli TaxID=52584 RepID=UPI0012F4BE4C|nr:DUF262 domain-containing protein [Brachyspira pilosicoli]